MKPPRRTDFSLIDVYVSTEAGASRGALDVSATSARSRGCFRLHRVEWRESILSTDGGQVIHRFQAPNAESVRIALRQAGISCNTVQREIGGISGD